MAINLSHPAIVDLIGGNGMTEQQLSRQLLIWWLINYERLDETDAQDSVCDSPNDQGIDGIVVDDDLGEIKVLSSVLRVGERGIGDTDLKDLEGSLAQLRTVDGVRQICNLTRNVELRTLLERKGIESKVGEGYTVRGILVTNGAKTDDATNYLKLFSHLELFDKQRLTDEYIEINDSGPVYAPVEYDITGRDRIVHALDDKKMVFIELSAKELLKMQGIADESLFAPNVRQWLKTTAVNRDLDKSIKTRDEHKWFPAFHNGLTVLCETLEIDDTSLRIDGYGVANGCQSLRSFFNNQTVLTPELQVLVRLVEEKPGTPLASKITNRSNNQNGVTPRDMKANSLLQTRLQTEINTQYPDEIYFRIKRGEHPEWPKAKVLENLLAGSILLAFDEKRPDSAHQKYKVFDDFYKTIFSGVTGHRVVVLYDLYNEVLARLNMFEDKLIGEYTQTTYIVLDLVRAILETDETGRRFIANMDEFVLEDNGRDRIRASLIGVLMPVIRLFNAEVNRKKKPPEGDNGEFFFDYKSSFKSAKWIGDLRETVKANYLSMLDVTAVKPFSVLWEESKVEEETK